MKRPIIRLAAALLATLSIAGCGSIPGEGPVEVGLTDLRQLEQSVQFNPPGPIPDSTQADVVRGFVLAATSSEKDYSVARQFLTKQYSGQWDPSSGVQIDEGKRSYHSEGDVGAKGAKGTEGAESAEGGIILLSLPLIANVDERGEMRSIPAGSMTDLRFEMQKVGGQWRIASAPNGLILDRSDFLAIWSSHELSFLGAGKYLVPETRWYLTSAALATEIVNGLVEGPSERMRGSIRTGFPLGSALASGTVPVVDGHAKIDFTGALLDAGPGVLDEIAGQLSASLRLVQGVTSFELLVDGIVTRKNSTNLRVDMRPTSKIVNALVQTGGQFGELVGGDVEKLPGLSETIVSLNPSAVTLSLGGDAAVVLSAVGVSRVSAEGSAVIDERGGVLQPSFDGQGNIWTVRAAPSTSFQVITPNEEVVSVRTPWLDNRKLFAARLSPDGSRIAVLVSDGDESVVFVSGVIRDESGVPVGISDKGDERMWVSGAPIDLDWIGQSRFAVLTGADGASGADGQTKITIGGLGLFPQDQGSVLGGRQLSGGNTREQLRVLNQEGELFAAQGSGWQRVDEGVELLAKRS